jgi:hypothetical protein
MTGTPIPIKVERQADYLRATMGSRFMRACVSCCAGRKPGRFGATLLDRFRVEAHHLQ